MRTHYFRRAGALATGALAAATFTVTGPAPTARAADPVPAANGAAWLEGRLVDGLLKGAYRDPASGDVFEYDDYGMTVEAAYALDAVGETDAIPGIVDAMEAAATEYTAPFEGTVYAGSTGKMLSLVSDFSDTDPTNVDGLDLVAQMEDRTRASGRIADLSDFGDFANTFGQAWAVRGLTSVESPESGTALSFLLDQQCDAGFFRLEFSPRRTCDAANPPVPPVDATAVVVILLADLAEKEPELAAALESAVSWLADQQAKGGSFDGGTATEGANANSTGLAGQALLLGGKPQKAAKAATWIRAHQVPGLACDGELADQSGAIAYDDAAYTNGQKKGIRQLTAGQWQTATVQALPALLSAPEATVPLDLDVPDFLDGGGTARFQVTGLAPGERGCVNVAENTVPVVGDAAGEASVRVPVPDRTDELDVDVHLSDESVGTQVLSLSGQRLSIDLRREHVAVGATQRVVVQDLVAGEKVVVKHDGEVVDRGTALGDGTFTVEFRVGRERGEQVVTARGQFPDRRGRATFEVG